MERALLVAQLLLTAVFATAALSKLDDLVGWRSALVGFGVPSRLAAVLGVGLPLAELATAGALMGERTARFGAAAALGLLLAFSAAIALNLLRGRTPECRCFGQVRSAPVSWRAIARNLGLAAAAGWVAAAGAGTTLDAREAGAIGAGILTGSLLLVAAARRRRGQGDQGLAVGAEAPDFRLQALDGTTVSLATLREGGQPALLVFSDPRCGPCSALAPRLASWHRDPTLELAVWVVARGELEENRAKAAEHGLANVLLDAHDAVADAYGARGTPSAVLVGADGRIASPVAVAGYGIEVLVAGIAGAPPPPRPAPVAQPRAEGSLTRLELLMRVGSAAAALALLGARDAVGGRIILKCKYVRCGNRCCPKTAVCGTRRGKKVCICPDGRETCGSKCCKETFVCHKNARGKKICVCPPGTRLCRGRCVPRTDPAHCGRCGNECPPATVCVNGACVAGDGTGTGPAATPPCECPPGNTCCDGACTDLNTDPAHCGRCDQPCPDGQACCDGTCKDLQLDPANCGQCGERCAAGQVCGGGRCGGTCPPGLTNCDGRCVDLAADDQNCGECGRACAEGLTCCGEADCVDTRIRHDHCTACFAWCDPFLCNCWDSRCGGFPEHGCWGTSPPPAARSRRRAGRGSRLGGRRRDRAR